jgi:hypothetical protein
VLVPGRRGGPAIPACIAGCSRGLLLVRLWGEEDEAGEDCVGADADDAIFCRFSAVLTTLPVG